MYSMDKEKARELYLSGMTCREVASVLGSDSGNVFRAIADIARTKLRPDSANWRTSRYRARKKMERHLGYTLNRLEHVHHIDEDFTNNSLDNLEVKSARRHISEHMTKPANIGKPKNLRKREYYTANKKRLDSYHQNWRESNPDKVSAIRQQEAITRRQFIHICGRCGKQFAGLKKSKYCGKSKAACNK